MKRLALLLFIAACDDGVLSGNPREDLDTLTSMVEVDCNTEPRCGEPLHCMTDALRDGKVAEFVTVVELSTYYDQYFFTYDGEVVIILKSRADGWMSEKHCRRIVPIQPTNACWDWGWTDCSTSW